jgi:hypothetical protein
MIEPAPWYRTAFRRNVIDMHITADDDRFMTGFDPQAYVDNLVKARVQSTVLYAISHIGLCYFPTQIGEMHPALQGRDVLGETLALCHQAGIKVVVYASLIFDLWAYRHHEDWKIHNVNGKPAAEESRYGVCCPNSPYREYVQAIAQELSTYYDFDGIRFDMTYWPQVCYCHHCQERFAREVGGELPTMIDWNDPHWVAFQRARERWLVEFAGLVTQTVRKFKPGASVEHQASTYPLTWRMGVSVDLAQHNDFLQGDFYGDALQGSFVRKLLSSISPNRPIGFETSITTELSNVTALKSEDLLNCKAAAAMADGTAFIMIDSIDPVGTLNPAVYDRMGRIFAGMQLYQPFLEGPSGRPLRDAAVYFSTESKFDPADNGKGVEDPTGSGCMPHMEAALGACKTLLDHHIPFGVITRRNLADLAGYKVILLPKVLMMDKVEADAMRRYVRGGGRLYASGSTSLQTPDGKRPGDFLLADVFGASYLGVTKEKFTYIAPAPGSEGLFTGYSYQYPVGFYTSQILIKAAPMAEPVGELVLPYTDPADPRTFASTHNNPPGRWTESPAVVLNHCGQGRCLYAAVDLESASHASDVFASLIDLLAGPFSLESNAPKAVEITAFDQPENRRTIIHLVNFQKELPNIPVDGIEVRLRIKGPGPQQVRLLPGGEPLAFEFREGLVAFSLPRLDTYLMVEIGY